jgi:adenine-specific DNA glycosylase
VEKDLMALLPPKEWVVAAHRLIHHGRAICKARQPSCARCPVEDLCPKRGVSGRAPRTRPAAARPPLGERIRERSRRH